MRKTIFFTLLSANALFLAWRLGYLDSMIPSGHEPARMLAQFNADKVLRAVPVPVAPTAPTARDGAGPVGGTGTAGEGNASAPRGAATGATGGAGTPGTTGPAVAPGTGGMPGTAGKTSAATGASGASASAASASTASASTPAGGSGAASAPVVAPSGGLKSVVASAAAGAAGAAACVDVAGFNTVDAKRFAAQVAAAIPGAKLTRREAPETSRQMVYIPSQGSREGAEKKAAELRRLGVTDLYIIQDNSPQRWGISLGIFRSDEAARAHLTALMRQGVRSARLLEMHVALTRLAYRVDGLDPAALARLESIRSDYSRQDWRSCQ